MTPQERDLVNELFDRLAQLEHAPRDQEAERLIADATRRAPHNLYALVQTVLVQDEVLKRANARIEDLEAQLSGNEQPQQPQGGFLDSMREALFGRSSVGPRSMPRASAAAPRYQVQAEYPPQRPTFPSAQPTPYPSGPFAGGGSFLGNAATTAAGMVGGALLLNSIRSMFGQHSGGQSAFGSSGDHVSHWRGDIDTGSEQHTAESDDGYATGDGEFIADEGDFTDNGGSDSDFA